MTQVLGFLYGHQSNVNMLVLQNKNLSNLPHGPDEDKFVSNLSHQDGAFYSWLVQGLKLMGPIKTSHMIGLLNLDSVGSWSSVLSGPSI